MKKRGQPIIESTPNPGDDWINKLFYTGGTVTGRVREVPRFSFPCKGHDPDPIPIKMQPYQERTIEALMDPRQHGKKLAHADFAAVERRVMAQLAERTRVHSEMLARSCVSPLSDENWRDLASVFDLILLRMMDKHLTYLFAYAGFEAVQQRIDEEGCGAFFAAAKAWTDAE